MMRVYNNNSLLIGVLLLVLHLFNIDRADATDCVYSTPDGDLDLRALSLRNRPRFQNIPDTEAQVLLKYSYNPCFSFTTEDPCKNAAACASKMISSSDLPSIDMKRICLSLAGTVSGQTELIARQPGRVFAYAQGLSTLTYTDGGNLKLLVFILCSPTPSVKATRDTNTQYFFYIEDPCGCAGKCTYVPDDDESGLTGGAVFVIILLVVVAVYLIGGVLFLRFARNESGVNLIPNRIFWLTLVTDAISGV